MVYCHAPKALLAVKRCFDRVDLTYSAGLIHLFSLAVSNTAYPLAAHLENHFGILLRLYFGKALAYFMYHWFFAVNRFAFVHGINSYLAVPVIAGGNNNRVNIFTFQYSR
jgi:uncharacterized membrane protein